MAGKARRSCLIVALMGVGLGLGVWTGPARAVETALQPPPGSPEWLKRQNELAIRAARQAYWPEAFYRWAKILRFRPDWAAIWNNLAVAMEAMGQWDKALAYYRKALELEPDNTAYRANYLRFREIQQKYRKSPPAGSSDTGERDGVMEWRVDDVYRISGAVLPYRPIALKQPPPLRKSYLEERARGVVVRA